MCRRLTASVALTGLDLSRYEVRKEEGGKGPALPFLPLGALLSLPPIPAPPSYAAPHHNIPHFHPTSKYLKARRTAPRPIYSSRLQLGDTQVAITP